MSFALLVLIQARDAAYTPAREELLAYARRASIPMACGSYLGGEKAGWMLTQSRVESHEGREVLVQASEIVLRTSYEGEESSSEEWRCCTYALDGRGELLAVEERDQEDSTRVARSATREGGKFRITVRGEGYETSREVDAPRSCLTDELRFEAWLAAAPESGARFEQLDLDLESEVIESPFEVRYVQPCRALLRGNFLPGHRLACVMMGFEIEITVLSDFRLVAGGKEGTFEFRLEDAETVKEIGAAPDHGFSIPCDERLGEPEGVRFLELELSAAVGARIPVDCRQVLVEEGGSRRLRIRRDPPGECPSSLSDAEAMRLTAATPALQSDHPKILEQARAIAGSVTSKQEAARALMTWVADMLEPTYAENASTALDVLTTRAGDCSEHALLFTALARALRIPSRVVSGLMYCGDELGVFTGHAWVEFHDGERWISVDPTWTQMPVDATHIKLDEDDTDGDKAWMNLIGRLELWVVDSERD